jgi:hypothetical protein
LHRDIVLRHADCREAISEMPDNSVDSIVTDPPYELGFMGKGWDSTGIANDPALWAEALRVLKPGGHLAAFSASRTYHRMACAIEDAGFEMRDSLMWLYGTGFPKSQNVAKFIDKELGTESEVVTTRPVTVQAQEFDGFGTALKPAFEPIVLARKPLSEKTVAANVLRWRTGALNIDACRVPGAKPDTTRGGGRTMDGWDMEGQGRILDDGKGRWPANVVHDGSDEVTEAFPVTMLAPDAPVKGTVQKATAGVAKGRERERVRGARDS